MPGGAAAELSLATLTVLGGFVIDEHAHALPHLKLIRPVHLQRRVLQQNKGAVSGAAAQPGPPQQPAARQRTTSTGQSNRHRRHSGGRKGSPNSLCAQHTPARCAGLPGRSRGSWPAASCRWCCSAAYPCRAGRARGVGAAPFAIENTGCASLLHLHSPTAWLRVLPSAIRVGCSGSSTAAAAWQLRRQQQQSRQQRQPAFEPHAGLTGM